MRSDLRRTRCALTAPFHPYRQSLARLPAVFFLLHWPSVSLEAHIPDVIRHTALRSPDFPPPLDACARAAAIVQPPAGLVYRGMLGKVDASGWESRSLRNPTLRRVRCGGCAERRAGQEGLAVGAGFHAGWIAAVLADSRDTGSGGGGGGGARRGGGSAYRGAAEPRTNARQMASAMAIAAAISRLRKDGEMLGDRSGAGRGRR